MENKCIACYEEMHEEPALECHATHFVHRACVAATGKAECPICRAPVQLSPELQSICDANHLIYLYDQEREEREILLQRQQDFFANDDGGDLNRILTHLLFPDHDFSNMHIQWLSGGGSDHAVSNRPLRSRHIRPVAPTSRRRRHVDNDDENILAPW